jgi:tRNA 2-thiouridine synthesizing protein A
MEDIGFRIYQLHAGICRMLANPKRLQMLFLLDQKEMSVGEIADRLGTPMATTSQHLSALKGKHLVEARKEGKTVYYRLRDRRVLEACVLIRSVLIDSMKERGELARDVSADTIRKREYSEPHSESSGEVAPETMNPAQTKGDESMNTEELKALKADIVVDARGTACPGPLLEAKRAMAKVPKNEGILEVFSSDEGTNEDIPLWATKVKHEFLGIIEEAGYWRVFVRRGAR